MAEALSSHDLCRLCLRWGSSNREVARLAGISPTTVAKYRTLLKVNDVTRETLAQLKESELQELLQAKKGGAARAFAEPDWSALAQEYKRRDVTVSLLYAEYLEAASPSAGSPAMSLSTFDRRLRGDGVSMRQAHPAGDSMCLDFSGKHLFVTDRETGSQTPVEIFVAALPHSRLIFAVAVLSQRKHDWIECNTRALEYLGGAPKMAIPDNLKSAVTMPRLGSMGPVINKTYLDFGDHYGIEIVPARPRKPKDKSHAEIAVRVVNIWIIARLRNHVFHSIEEINSAIAPLIEQINDKPRRKLGGRSRRELFEEFERVTLTPLPPTRFEYVAWISNVRVPLDYHISFRGDYYSVPHSLVGKTVTLGVSRSTVKIYGEIPIVPVAVHPLGSGSGATLTSPEHQTGRHRMYAAQNVDELVRWAEETGPEILALFRSILANKRIPPISAIRQMGRVQKLLTDYGSERLTNACAIANVLGVQHVENLVNILKNEIDLRKRPNSDEARAHPVAHDNIRGPDAYSGA